MWPLADVQTCVVHLVRNTLRLASRGHWPKITAGLRRVYTAPTLEAAEARFEDFESAWGVRYPAIISLWRSAWDEFIPFLAFPTEIRSMIYTTNAIENLNARFRRATRIRGHFPNETAALKILYLTIRERDTKGGNVVGRVRNWKQVLNTLMLHYGDRVNT